MTNKYTYWRSGSYYDNADLLYSQYQNLVQKPFYYSGSDEIHISHFQNNVFPDESARLSSEDLMKHIQKLLTLGILECNTIYSVATQNCSIPARYLKCYRIALGGTKFVREIFSHSNFFIRKNVF